MADIVVSSAVDTVLRASDQAGIRSSIGLGTAAQAASSAFATASQGAKADTAIQPGALSAVATSGQYGDLSGRPALGTAAAQNSTAFATAAQGAKADTALQPGGLAAVAVSGDYSDLTDRPTLGTAAQADAIDFATASQGSKADTALQPGGLSTVATSGQYSDLLYKPTLGTAAAADTSDFADSSQGAKADSAVQPSDLAAVATSGDYSDLTTRPTLGDLAAKDSVGVADVSATGTPGSTTYLRGDGTWATPPTGGGSGGGGGDLYAVNNLSDLDDVATARGNLGLGSAAVMNSSAFATAAQGAKADTAVQPGSLSTVATTGDYLDLGGRPTLGTAASQNATAFATAAQGAKADTALQPGSLSAVATTGEYGDLMGTPSLGALAAMSTVPLANIDASGTRNSSRFLRGDGQWAEPPELTGALMVNSNLSDLQSAAAARANLGLHAIAASGDYSDLVDAPALGALATLNSVTVANISAGGAASSGTFLRGDGQWGTPSAPTPSVQHSIESDAGYLQLVGDAASPGNGRYYGTDNLGAKGFHTLPSPPTPKNSIETNAGQLQLVSDSSSPGNSRYYGTNSSGTKGFFNLPEVDDQFSAVVTESGAARTLAIGDIGRYIRLTRVAGCNITVPPQSSVAWIADTEIYFRNASEGPISIIAGSGVTINNAAAAADLEQHDTFALKRVASNVWDFI